MNRDSTKRLNEENKKALRADFLKLLKGIKQYRDGEMAKCSRLQRLRMENLLKQYERDLESGITRHRDGVYGAIDLANGYDSVIS